MTIVLPEQTAPLTGRPTNSRNGTHRGAESRSVAALQQRYRRRGWIAGAFGAAMLFSALTVAPTSAYFGVPLPLRYMANGVIFVALVAVGLRLEQWVRTSHVEVLKGFVGELTSANEQLLWLAGHDPLTGTANRRLLFTHMEERMVAGSPFAVAIVDVDQLKALNDRCGHGVGDEALVRAVQRLQSVVREADIVARIGGDEFVLLATGATPRELETRCERALRSPVALNCGEGVVNVTFSCGVAAYPEDGDNPDAVLAAADARMYLRKNARTQGAALEITA